MSNSEGTDFPKNLLAVVVTYHPDDHVVRNIAAIVAECGRAIIVDNGSERTALHRLHNIPGVEVVSFGENRGIAAALNAGFGLASTRGAEWVVCFDQDSRPEAGMVRLMWEAHLAVPEAVIIGPQIQEHGSTLEHYRWLMPNQYCPVLFRRASCSDANLVGVTIVITSGSMINIAGWQRLNGFDDGLFIDYVDTEFCLRAIRNGMVIAVAQGAVLVHHLGARKSRMLLGRDFRPTHHAPFRHYYMARNRVTAWRRHAWAVPHWAAFDLSFAVYNLGRVLLFEDQRWAKLRAIVRGTFDGMRGKRGALT